MQTRVGVRMYSYAVRPSPSLTLHPSPAVGDSDSAQPPGHWRFCPVLPAHTLLRYCDESPEPEEGVHISVHAHVHSMWECRVYLWNDYLRQFQCH